MKEPRSPIVRLVWCLSTVLWVAHPFIMMKYWSVTQRLGWYPPEADSILIPIMGDFLLAIVGYPVMFILCRKATRRVRAPFNLFRWDKSRPVRSAMISLVFLLLAASSTVSVFHSLRLLAEIRASRFSHMQDAAVYRIVFSMGWVVLWMVLRSCFMTRGQAEPVVALDDVATAGVKPELPVQGSEG